MESRVFKKNLTKSIVVLGLTLSAPMLPTFAEDGLATLSGIEINPYQSSYEIVLNTDKKTSFEKQIKSDDKVLINIKGASISKDSNTVYNNAKGIDHVIFKPLNNDNVQILVQGNNVSDSTIRLNPENPSETTAEDSLSNTVFLKKPVDSYAPIYEEEEATGFNLNGLRNSLSLGKILNKNNLGFLSSFGMFLILLFVLRRPKQKEDKKITIKLSENIKEKEIDLHSQINKKRDFNTNQAIGLKSLKEEDVPMSNPISGANNINKAYGLRSYESAVQPRLNRPLPPVSPIPAQPKATRPTLNQPKTLRSNAIQARSTAFKNSTLATAISDPERQDIQIDNVKFLESMAKIYEKSGRIDLANGLQHNIKKAKKING